MDLKLTNRYILKGTLIMKTGLHVGSGSVTSATDNPVIREASGKPFIPGSSFKGVLRSTVEKIIPLLTERSGLWTCQLFSESEGARKCLSTPSNQKKLPQLRDEAEKRTLMSESKVLSKNYKDRDSAITERFILEEYLPDNLCDTCKLFGSSFVGSKIKVQDLPICEPYYEIAEIRDGVGIDRDTEVAVDQAKYDFEVIPSLSEFQVNIVLEGVSEKELAIFALGIREFTAGCATMGGLSSRGLGACQLEIEGIEFVDFTNQEHLEQYLIEGKVPDQLSQGELFDKIKTLLTMKQKGVVSAETISE